MNMLQMLGGVAVAGAVAAGTTAFTASGVNLGGSLASGLQIGGTTSVSVTGFATLDAMAITQSASLDQITGVTITMKNSADTTVLPNNADAKLKVRFTGTGGTATTGTWGPCVTDGSGTADGGFTCAVPGSAYFVAISAVEIAYVP